MPALPAITVGNANTTGLSTLWTSYPDGNLGDNSDATYGYVNNNGTNAYDMGWEMGDTPSDFGTMTALSVVLRYCWGTDPGTASTWPGLECRITASDGTTVYAGAGGGGWLTVVASVANTVTTPTDSGSVGMVLTAAGSAATKSEWDAAILQIRIQRTKVKGGSSDQQRVHEADLTGTYDVAPAGWGPLLGSGRNRLVLEVA